MPVAIPAECRSRSRRNSGRNQIGMPVAIGRNTQVSYLNPTYRLQAVHHGVKLLIAMMKLFIPRDKLFIAMMKLFIGMIKLFIVMNKFFIVMFKLFIAMNKLFIVRVNFFI